MDPRSRALEMLAESKPVPDVAEATGLDVETLRGWLRGDAEFVAEINQARAERLRQLRAGVSRLASEATDVLGELLRSPETPPAVRLRVAMAVLAYQGADKPEPIGPADPSGIRVSMAIGKMFG